MTAHRARGSIRIMSRSFAATLVFCLILFVWSCAARAEGDWAPPGTVITMVRGGCEKRCPVYRVVIFGDGTVIVQGRHYLKKPILAQAEIPAGDVMRLVNRFKAMNYFHLADDFGFQGKGCTSTANNDAPNVTTTLVTDGLGKSITHHQSCLGDVPDQLTNLERAIDETAHTARWLKDAPPDARR